MVLGSGATDITPRASLCLQELPVNSETKDCSSEKCWERGARRDPKCFGRGPVILHVGILRKVPLLLICHSPAPRLYQKDAPHSVMYLPDSPPAQEENCP